MGLCKRSCDSVRTLLKGDRTLPVCLCSCTTYLSMYLSTSVTPLVVEYRANHRAGFVFVATIDNNETTCHKPPTCIRGLLTTTVNSRFVNDLFLLEMPYVMTQFTTLTCFKKNGQPALQPDDMGQPPSMPVDPIYNQHQPKLFWKQVYLYMSVA